MVLLSKNENKYMPYEDTYIKIKVFILISVLGIGIAIHFLHNIKVDDEPSKSSYIPIVTFTSSSYIGTASTTTTTF